MYEHAFTDKLKDDKGDPILELVDITEDGTHILEPYVDLIPVAST